MMVSKIAHYYPDLPVSPSVTYGENIDAQHLSLSLMSSAAESGKRTEGIFCWKILVQPRKTGELDGLAEKSSDLLVICPWW